MLTVQIIMDLVRAELESTVMMPGHPQYNRLYSSARSLLGSGLSVRASRPLLSVSGHPRVVASKSYYAKARFSFVHLQGASVVGQSKYARVLMIYAVPLQGGSGTQLSWCKICLIGGRNPPTEVPGYC